MGLLRHKSENFLSDFLVLTKKGIEKRCNSYTPGKVFRYGRALFFSKLNLLKKLSASQNFICILFVFIYFWSIFNEQTVFQTPSLET